MAPGPIPGKREQEQWKGSDRIDTSRIYIYILCIYIYYDTQQYYRYVLYHNILIFILNYDLIITWYYTLLLLLRALFLCLFSGCLS
jgi:hypothetical protein